jgi:hypothetical protein
MDTRKLFEMTRSQLEAEARKHGVEAPEVLTRHELIDVILARAGQRRGPLSAARDLVSWLVAFARRSQTASARAPSPPLPSPDPDSARISAAPSSFAAGGAPNEERRATSANAVEGEASPPTERTEAASTPEARPESGAPEGVPILTRTMARLYAEQGHVELALRVYDGLLARAVDDDDLRREAEALRQRARAAASATSGEAPPSLVAAAPGDPGPAPMDATKTTGSGTEVPRSADVDTASASETGPAFDLIRSPAMTYGRDEVLAIAVDATTVYAHWEATGPSLDRAALTAGEGARPCLRVVVVSEGPRGVPRTRFLQEPVPAAGETFLRELPPSASVVVAVGVLARDRFVAVAHAPPVVTPPAAPSDSVAVRFARPPAPRREGRPRDHASAPAASRPPVVLPFDPVAAREALRVAAAVDAGALEPDRGEPRGDITGGAPRDEADAASPPSSEAVRLGSSEHPWRSRLHRPRAADAPVPHVAASAPLGSSAAAGASSSHSAPRASAPPSPSDPSRA